MDKFILWQKVAAIIMLLAKRMEIEPRKALDIFYDSQVGRWVLSQQHGLHTMSDEYIVDEIMSEGAQCGIK